MFKELFTEDRGVSPVIGVILMVAITVILAAVIGAFVLGLGDQVSNNAPQASFEFKFADGKDINITHGGGDNIEANELTVSVSGQTVYNDSSPVSTPDDTFLNNSNNGWTDTISTGDTLDMQINRTNVDTSGETVRIVWNNPSGGSSNTIGERDWPA